MAVSGAAFAQGYITWSFSTGVATFQTNSTAYSPLFGGGSAQGGAIGLTSNTGLGFYYALLNQADPNNTTPTDKNVWDGTWTGLTGFGGIGNEVLATNSTSALATQHGAAVQELNGVGAGSVQVNWAAGVTNGIVLVGWSANLGTTWTSVSNILKSLAAGNTAPLIAQVGSANAFFGETALGDIAPGSVAGAGNAILVGSAAQVYGTAINAVGTTLYLLPVPEPGTLALAGLGGLSMLLFRRQRK